MRNTLVKFSSFVDKPVTNILYEYPTGMLSTKSRYLEGSRKLPKKTAQLIHAKLTQGFVAVQADVALVNISPFRVKPNTMASIRQSQI